MTEMTSLDGEFRDVSRRIAVRFAELMNVKIAEQRQAIIRSIEEDIAELDFVIAGVDERARLEPRFLSDARQMRRERDQIENELDKFKSSAGTSRWQTAVASEQEFRSRSAVDDSVQRQLVLGTHILEQGSQTLARTHHLALETEQVGVETAAELALQREKLERSRDRLGDTNADLSISTRIIQRLKCGVLQSRLLLMIIIIVELLIIGAIIAIRILVK